MESERLFVVMRVGRSRIPVRAGGSEGGEGVAGGRDRTLVLVQPTAVNRSTRACTFSTVSPSPAFSWLPPPPLASEAAAEASGSGIGAAAPAAGRPPPPRRWQTAQSDWLTH